MGLVFGLEPSFGSMIGNEGKSHRFSVFEALMNIFGISADLTPLFYLVLSLTAQVQRFYRSASVGYPAIVQVLLCQCKSQIFR